MDSGTTDQSASPLPRSLAKLWREHPLAVVAGVGLLALAIIVILIWPITDLIAAHDVGLIARTKRAAALQVAREAVRTQLLTLGAGLFAAAALVFTAWNVTLYRKSLTLIGDTNRIAEQGQVTDRFTNAIDQLGSHKLDVRIGAIYALDRISRDSPSRYHETVITVLAAFVREHSHEQWPPLSGIQIGPVARTTRPDVQAAASIVCFQDAMPYMFDLSGVELPGAKLARARLRGANFENFANFDHANLIKANLRRARLNHASFIGAYLDDADFRKASLIDAHFDSTDLSTMKLRGAHLDFAHFNNADLKKVPDLSEVDFAKADLTGAKWPKHVAVPPGWTWQVFFTDQLRRAP